MQWAEVKSPQNKLFNPRDRNGDKTVGRQRTGNIQGPNRDKPVT